MKKLNCVIVDDEPRNVELLYYYIKKYCPELEVDAEFSRRSLAEAYFEDNTTDVLFWTSYWTTAVVSICWTT